MKKIMTIAFVAAFAAVAGYGVYANQQSETMSNLALANVEALAGGESTTTWDCDGWWGDCYAYCGVCGTKVDGDGSIKGSHSCSGISH